jgi:hypothetical protein
MPDFPTSPSDNRGTGSSAAGPQAARRIVSTLLGFEAACCLVLAMWPGLLRYVARQLGAGIELPEGLVRILAIGGFIGSNIARVVIRGPVGPSRTALAWTEFATQTGGSFTQEPRRLTGSGWEGGPMVSWTLQGVPVTLRSVVRSQNSALARFSCAVRLAHPYSFSVSPRTFLTRTLGSPKVWGMVLVVAKNAAPSGGSPDLRKQEMEQLAILASQEQAIGDPLFDQAFSLKSSDEATARDFFSDAGVGHWLQELNGKTRQWSASLLACDASGGYQLGLDLLGMERDPETLRIAHSWMDAAIGRLRARGMLGDGRSAA